MEFFASLSPYSKTMLGVCVALLLVVLAEIAFLGGASRAAPVASSLASQEPAASSVVPQSLQIPPVAAYREVKERPLFSDTRRPPPTPKSAGTGAARATPLLGKWKVTGIVVAGQNSFALVEGMRDRKTVRLQLGTPLDGWQLDEIHPDHLVFSSDGANTVLQLRSEEEASRPSRQ